jgi:Uncharacterized protein conserved in bacteria (DUF2213)
MNELDVARAVASGEMLSPTEYYGSVFFAVRVSGTGVAYRGEPHNEFCLRPKATWTDDTMQRRVLGLPVLAGHPAGGVLNSQEFAARVIGIVVFSFVRDDALWGVMRVIDRDAAAALADGDYDSSPAVQFSPGANFTADAGDGDRLLVEGDPAAIDHVAVVPRGVWTRPGDQAGVQISNDENLELETFKL